MAHLFADSVGFLPNMGVRLEKGDDLGGVHAESLGQIRNPALMVKEPVQKPSGEGKKGRVFAGNGDSIGGKKRAERGGNRDLGISRFFAKAQTNFPPQSFQGPGFVFVL